MGFVNGIPKPQFDSVAAAAVSKKSLGNPFDVPSAGGSVSPLATDASSSGPNYGVSYAPSLQLSGSYTPDYNALINDQPGLIAYRGTGAQTIADSDSGRRAAVRALAVQYGGLPSNVSDTYGDLDPTTMDLASRNQFSDIANLGRNYDQTVEGVKRSLAARGALNSSELGYGLDQANLSRGQQEYTLGSNFANAFQTAVNNYAQSANNVRAGESQAIADAAKSVYGNPAYRPSDAVMANYLEGSNEKYGQPVYTGPDGKLYGADGSVFTPPPADTTTTDTTAHAGGSGGSIPAPSGPIGYAGPFIGPSQNDINFAARAALGSPDSSGLTRTLSSARSALGYSTPYGNAYQRHRQAA